MPRRDLAAPGLTEALVASAARTTSDSSTATAGWGAADTLRVQLNVTAASGVAPTLDVLIQDTLDGTNWNTVASFTQATAATREVINVTAPFTDTLRVRWVVAGTSPSFTFAVDCYSE